MNRFPLVVAFAFGLFVVAAPFAAFADAPRAASVPNVSPSKTDGSESTQLLRVVVPDPTKSGASVVGLVRDDSQSVWREELSEMPAQIGRNGLARPGVKKEKDGRTPAGEFSLGFVFGRDKRAPDGVSLPYRQAKDDDFWIDDETSPLYNRWFSGPKPTVSHERLRLPDGPDPSSRNYDWALIIEYNFDPIVPGAGSAIFLHLWTDSKTPTSGCVALSRENVLRILRWLDPKKKPRIRVESTAFDALNRSSRNDGSPKLEQD